MNLSASAHTAARQPYPLWQSGGQGIAGRRPQLANAREIIGLPSDDPHQGSRRHAAWMERASDSLVASFCSCTKRWPSPASLSERAGCARCPCVASAPPLGCGCTAKRSAIHFDRCSQSGSPTSADQGRTCVGGDIEALSWHPLPRGWIDQSYGKDGLRRHDPDQHSASSLRYGSTSRHSHFRFKTGGHILSRTIPRRSNSFELSS